MLPAYNLKDQIQDMSIIICKHLPLNRFYVQYKILFNHFECFLFCVNRNVFRFLSSIYD